jgi:chromosomal replication initiator protein
MDDKDIGSAVVGAISDRVGRDRFRFWCGDGEGILLFRDRIVIQASSHGHLDLLRTEFRPHVIAACKDVLGHELPVHFEVREAGPAPSEAANNSPSATRPQAEPVPSAETGTDAALRTFASFVVGHGNRLAHTSAMMVCDKPGSPSPLFFHGLPGVGKTHLMRAILASVRKQRKGDVALWLSAEQFTSLYVEAVCGTGMPNFRRKYRSVQMLLVDDVQFICNKRGTTGEFLHTVDALLRDGRQVVLSADRPPHELDGLGPELASRLQAGLVCRIDPPDFDTRLGIVSGLARRSKAPIPDEVCRLIAATVMPDARELAGAFHLVEATSLARGRPVDQALAEEALLETTRSSARVVRLEDIASAVSTVFGLEPGALSSSRQTRSVSGPRLVAMWLARKHTRVALSEIGQYFGRRSHSTVVAARRRVEEWMAGRATIPLFNRDLPVEEAIRRVEERLKIG